jgi:hypothetical protein
MVDAAKGGAGRRVAGVPDRNRANLIRHRERLDRQGAGIDGRESDGKGREKQRGRRSRELYIEDSTRTPRAVTSRRGGDGASGCRVHHPAPGDGVAGGSVGAAGDVVADAEQRGRPGWASGRQAHAEQNGGCRYCHAGSGHGLPPESAPLSLLPSSARAGGIDSAYTTISSERLTRRCPRSQPTHGGGYPRGAPALRWADCSFGRDAGGSRQTGIDPVSGTTNQSSGEDDLHPKGATAGQRFPGHTSGTLDSRCGIRPPSPL